MEAEISGNGLPEARPTPPPMLPTTEAPPPSQPPAKEPPRAGRPRSPRERRKAGEYDNLGDLDSYDLIHVIDDLEDERSRLALREKIWIALIFHLLLFGYLVFAPKYIWHVKVRDPSLALRDKEKQPTFLDLPPDALKQLQPKKPAPLSDKNRQQQAPKPTLDRKTLEQLQAMRRVGPPLPSAPAPRPSPQPPAPAPPQVAQQQPKPQPPPVAPTQSAQIEAPKPQPTKPNFAAAGPQTPSEAVQQAARAAHNGSGAYSDSGEGGANAPLQHPGQQGAVDVLSDTLGVDFGPYIQRVIFDTKRAWYPIIPGVAQPPISKQGKVLIRFKILPDGSVKEMHLEGPSGDVSLDRAAWGGITGAMYPPLPKNFKGPFLELRFYFLYNDNAGIR